MQKMQKMVDYKTGKCQNCKMAGFLRQRAWITDEEQILWVCVTCFETPSGFPSDNVGHKRLPEGEYK